MFKTTTLVLIFFVFGISAHADDDADYRGWMKQVGPAVMEIRKAPADASVAPDAVKLVGIFEKVAYYWRARHQEEAAKLAETAVDAAKGLTSKEDRPENLKKLLGTCGPCHMEHRGGSAPNFTFK